MTAPSQESPWQHRLDAAGRLRTALRQRRPAGPLRAFGAVNALAAKVAADAGADALWVSSLEVSSAAGLPDTNVLCVHDLAEVVTALTAVTALPVVVDIDNGGGSVAAAHRYVRQLVAAGAAACCLEDSRYPKTNSFSTTRRQRLADIDLVCDQLREMRAVAGDRLVVVGRTESLICEMGMPVALARAERFVECGVDAVLVHSKDRTGAEAMAVAAAWQAPVPLVVVPTAFPTVSWQELGDAGFRLCIYANQLSRAAVAAMQRCARDIVRDGVGSEHGLIGVDELLALGELGSQSCR